MKTIWLPVCVLASSLFGCSKPTEPSTTPTFLNFDSLVDAYHEDQLHFYPLMATSAGDNRFNDTLPNSLTSAFRTKLSGHYTHYLDALQQVDTNTLTVQQRLSYDVLQWDCGIALENLKHPSHLIPIDQFWSLHLQIGQLASGSGSQPFKTEADYSNWLKRLDDYMDWCDTAVANMRQGIQQGIVLPKSLVIKVIPQFRALEGGDVEKHLFYGPIRNLPEGLANADVIRNQYRDYLTQVLMPRYKSIADFLEQEYLPAARETSGISGLPGGADWYQSRIRYYTTTNMTPDEIFALGLAEVDRLEAEMMMVMASVEYMGNYESFMDHVRTKKELMPYTDAQQVIDNFNAIHDKMKPNIAKLFNTIPKTPFEVRRTEAFREASASAEYQSGSLDGTRPGIFYVPVPDVRNYNVYSDEDLFLHEAIPGHHFQESWQHENDELPMFRKLMWYSSYGEGWALYTESLGKELGLYEDPYQYLGMLGAEMHRAIRLVVDVGMHSKGWTREDAIDYSLKHEAETRAAIISEIERYMAGPGQALSYKIGQLKIRELRARAEKALGDQFNIKDFHDTVLETGCVPLYVLEKHVDRWIKKESQS
ncbi:MAG: DUF885 domain-containing protein [Bacteroidetes bacterium]|nr:DUF885 domain-containing protein [Bacteroidota bacterium]